MQWLLPTHFPWPSPYKYLAWWATLLLWMSSWLAFLTWSCCGHFLCDCVFFICLCCFFSFPYLPGSLFWNLASCLYPFSQIHAPFHSFSMWLLGRDALHRLTLPPLSDPNSDFAASDFFISPNWPLDTFLRPYFLQVMEPLIASQGGLSFMILRF